MRRRGKPRLADLIGGIEPLLIVLLLRDGKARSRSELQKLVGAELLDFELLDLETWGMLELKGQEDEVVLTPAGMEVAAQIRVHRLESGVCIQLTFEESESSELSVFL